MRHLHPLEEHALNAHIEDSRGGSLERAILATLAVLASGLAVAALLVGRW